MAGSLSASPSRAVPPPFSLSFVVPPFILVAIPHPRAPAMHAVSCLPASRERVRLSTACLECQASGMADVYGKNVCRVAPPQHVGLVVDSVAQT